MKPILLHSQYVIHKKTRRHAMQFEPSYVPHNPLPKKVLPSPSNESNRRFLSPTNPSSNNGLRTTKTSNTHSHCPNQTSRLPSEELDVL